MVLRIFCSSHSFSSFFFFTTPFIWSSIYLHLSASSRSYIYLVWYFTCILFVFCLGCCMYVHI
ncbi:hypothetical protein B0H19DRAFT_1091213 [Mycena capillaripes]|nr:hypothetical protein B0H19DRAFT_1091213 [Mycena capillaripes]